MARVYQPRPAHSGQGSASRISVGLGTISQTLFASYTVRPRQAMFPSPTIQNTASEMESAHNRINVCRRSNRSVRM